MINNLLKQRWAKNKIHTLLLDLDGTLYSSKAGIENEIKPQMWRCLSEELSIDIEEAKRRMWACIEKYEHEAIGLRADYNIDLDEFYNKVYTSIDISRIVPYEGLVQVFENLSRKVSIVVFTNSAKIHASRVLDRLDLSNFVSRVISFEDNNYIRKPDKRAFQSIINLNKIVPRSTIYIDDSLPNLWTAHNLLFWSLLVSNGLVEQPYFMEMHMRVKHLAPEFIYGHDFNIVNLLNSLLDE